MHLFYGLTRRASSVLVQGICTILVLGSPDQPTAWDRISVDLKTLFKRYRLDPVTHSHICCPRCFALYDPSSSPRVCTFQEFKDSAPCNTPLFKTRTIRSKTHTAATRLYLHQDLKEWVGRLLSRADLEELLDKPLPVKVTKYMEDIWHGSVLSKEFTDPGGSRFVTETNGPLRLVFGLAVDGFNSYRNLQAKKKTSSTGIYMVCYNIPADIRYLPENMYLAGVIPGKPSLDQINHALALLVKDLTPFWSPGVYYTQTATRCQGRHVNAALIPLISDVLAARQVAGFSSSSHTLFCMFCLLTSNEIENLEPSSWHPRTWEFHIKGVEAWRNARNSTEREAAFERYGARWSALLDLPYWKPLEYTVIDSMHNHYLGLLHNHLRSVWGMNIEAEDGDGTSNPTKKRPPVPAPKVMQSAIAILASKDKERLLKLKHHVLWHLCATRDLRRAKNKKMMVQELLGWVCFVKDSHAMQL